MSVHPVRRLVLVSMVLCLLITMGLVLLPPAASASTRISDTTHLTVCRQVYGKRYSWVKQLDPNSVKYTSLASAATLCNGTDPVISVDLAQRACKGKMIVAAYTVVPWWKWPWVKPQFLGWNCA